MDSNKIEKHLAPSLQFSILCDGVAKPDQRGKLSVIGIFDEVLMPAIVPHFSLVLCWKKGIGKFKSQVKILDPKLKVMVSTPKVEVVLNHETQPGNQIFNFEGVNFAKAGVYWIEVVLDGETVQSIPVPVRKNAN